MKIKTKIIGISSVAVLTATLLISGIIWDMLRASQNEEAKMQAYQSCYIFFNKLEENQIDEVHINYFMKLFEGTKQKKRDVFNLCFRQDTGDEIYNSTIFSMEDLEKNSFRLYQENGDIFFAKMNYEEKEFLVFQKQFGKEFVVYQISDITDVKKYVERLGIMLLFTSFGVTAFTVLALWISVRHMIKPLNQLNESAKKIANGVYSDRVKVKGKDEIAELGKSFNQMAEAVETKTRHLEESEKRKTLFMGNLTHELKTPMTAISGYAQTLLTTKLTPEDQEEAYVYIYEQCNRLERLSKKMMRLLELENEQVLNCVDVAAEYLFSEAKKSCDALLKQKSMTLECISHGEIYHVDVDLMLDVLLNLIDNGIKASEPGSKICLIASEKQITVQDFGRGIPEEEKERILEPFYMIDKSRSRKSGGAGLGLSLIALIIKHHHMTMEIESEPGKGTSINLQFAYKTMNT